MTSTPKRPLLSTFVIAAVSLASPLLSSSARANLVVNGGFEASVGIILPVTGTAVGGGDTAWMEGALLDVNGNPVLDVDGNPTNIIQGWNVGPSGNGKPNVKASNKNVYYATGSDPVPSPPPGGPHGLYGGNVSAVFLNGSPYDGYISQAIATTLDQTYRISYWLSNQIGDYPNNALRVHWGGTDTGNGISDGINPDVVGKDDLGIAQPTALTVPLGWTHYSVDVQGLAGTTLLSFIGGNTAAGNLLDDVSVIAVPEVSSFGTLTGIALLAFGTAARFRRRAVATA